jgi:hypothetical protein
MREKKKKTPQFFLHWGMPSKWGIPEIISPPPPLQLHIGEVLFSGMSWLLYASFAHFT